MGKVAKLMNNHVINYFGWSHHQFPVETDDAAIAATSPATPVSADPYAGWCKPGSGYQALQALIKVF
jgi:hypothetical protein